MARSGAVGVHHPIAIGVVRQREVLVHASGRDCAQIGCVHLEAGVVGNRWSVQDGVVAMHVPDGAAVERQGIGVDADAVGIVLSSLHGVGEGQCGAARAAEVIGLHQGAADVERQLGRAGDGDGFDKVDLDGGHIACVQALIEHAGGTDHGQAGDCWGNGHAKHIGHAVGAVAGDDFEVDVEGVGGGAAEGACGRVEREPGGQGCVAAQRCAVGQCAVHIAEGVDRDGVAERCVVCGHLVWDQVVHNRHFVDVGHRHGHVLVGVATRCIGGAHGHVVDVVSTCIGRHLKIRCGNESQNAGAAVNAELGTIRACTGVDAVNHARASCSGVNGCGVFCHAGRGWARENGSRQDVQVQGWAGHAFVASGVCERESEGITACGQCRGRRECACAAVVSGSRERAIDVKLGRVGQASAHLNAGCGVIGVGRRVG